MRHSHDDLNGQLGAAIAALLEAPRILADLRREVADLTQAVKAMEARLPPFLVDMNTAAKALRCSRSSVRRRVKTRERPVVKIGSLLRIDLTKVKGVDRDETSRLAREARGR
jgi:hypothetical protein